MLLIIKVKCFVLHNDHNILYIFHMIVYIHHYTVIIQPPSQSMPNQHVDDRMNIDHPSHSSPITGRNNLNHSENKQHDSDPTNNTQQQQGSAPPPTTNTINILSPSRENNDITMRSAPNSISPTRSDTLGIDRSDDSDDGSVSELAGYSPVRPKPIVTAAAVSILDSVDSGQESDVTSRMGDDVQRFKKVWYILVNNVYIPFL